MYKFILCGSGSLLQPGMVDLNDVWAFQIKLNFNVVKDR